MKTRAAVAFAPKQPLEIVEVDLAGPKAGEVLVEIMATGICHTDAYTLDGFDSEGIFPSILGHEGAGIVREVGPGVTSVKPGDHVIPLYTPECRQCKSCLSGKTNLCTAIRATQGQGLAGANKIIGVDINPDREEWGRRFGMTDFLNTKGMSREDIVAKIVLMTDGGADYTFDATGNTEVMRTALEACHRGWGTSIIIGVAEAGKEISTRPFQLVTGRNWRGTAFGGAKGRTDVPKIVDMYMTGKIEIDPMITHVMGLEEINTAFDLMHAGKSIRSVVVY